MSEELLNNAISVLNTMLERLDVKDVHVTIADIPTRKLDLKCEQAGRLIGRKGQYLEALELIMNRVLRRQEADEENTPWVAIEIDGYSIPHKTGERHGGRLPREDIDQLTAMALDVAKEVKLWKEAKVIGPYRPAERRVIHIALRDDPMIETISDAEADANGCKRISIQLVENGKE